MDDRLKIFALVTKSHEPMLNDWFLKTIPSDCRPIVNFVHSEPMEFRKGNWHKIFAQKVEMVLEAIKEPGLIAVSDVDVQFFKPMAADLREQSREYDIVFQNNACGRSYDLRDLCAGFMAVNCSPSVKPFFEEAYRQILKIDDPRTDDQVVYANILKDFPNLKVGLLPDRYWTHAKKWDGKLHNHQPNPPEDIILHHANWVVGNEIKIEQLKRVRIATQESRRSRYIPRFQA